MPEKSFRLPTIVRNVVIIVLCLVVCYQIHDASYATGYKAGLNAGYQAASEELTAITGNYASDPESMANRIVAAEGGLLPVTSTALDENVPGLAFKELHMFTGFETVSDFYESLGITLDAPAPECPGWYYCTLPEGWRISYDNHPNRSRDEDVHFYDANGNQPFYLITYKSADNQFASLAGYYSVD